MRRRTGFYGVLALIVLATSTGFASAASPPSPQRTNISIVQPGAKAPRSPERRPVQGGLRGGVLATFEVAGEVFRVWVTNPQTIGQLFALREGTSTASIPSGRILRGPGQAAHNAPWSWHLDPVDIAMADFTIELCDARPSYVEENVSYFVDVVGRYCPWAAVLVDLRDLR